MKPFVLNTCQVVVVPADKLATVRVGHTFRGRIVQGVDRPTNKVWLQPKGK